MALAASRTLFASAPTVVTAPVKDSRAQERGAKIAAEIGAPMLLAPGAGSDGANGGGKSLLAELQRLGAETLLSVGQGPGPPEEGSWERSEERRVGKECRRREAGKEQKTESRSD